ncbi:MAG: acyl-CoA thioesterase [Beutenbergiaceae bacterium]
MARVSIPVQIRWSDIDGYGHVNNAALLTLLEQARIATFWKPERAADQEHSGQPLPGGLGAERYTLVARQEVEYLAPLGYSQRPARIELWLAEIGGASLEVNYQVYSPDEVLCAMAATTIVMVDAHSGSPRRFTAAERGALHGLRDEPIRFRRRR